MSTLPSNRDDYYREGIGHAFDTLWQGCDIPPSLEVFKYELALNNNRRVVTPSELAEAIVRNYSRYPV